MSIIQEAIKKVEKEKELELNCGKIPIPDMKKADAPGQVKIELPAMPPKKKAPAQSRLRFALVLIFAALSIAFIVNQLLWQGSSPDVSPAAKDPAEAPSRQEVVYKSAPRAKTTRQNAPVKAPSFNLSGIMFLEDGPRAVINNSMVEVGDTIGGGLVTKIDKKRVVLSCNDTEIIVYLK